MVSLKDYERFDIAVRQIVGKRLTLDRLTGKEDRLSPECSLTRKLSVRSAESVNAEIDCQPFP